MSTPKWSVELASPHALPSTTLSPPSQLPILLPIRPEHRHLPVTFPALTSLLPSSLAPGHTLALHDPSRTSIRALEIASPGRQPPPSRFDDFFPSTFPSLRKSLRSFTSPLARSIQASSKMASSLVFVALAAAGAVQAGESADLDGPLRVAELTMRNEQL